MDVIAAINLWDNKIDELIDALMHLGIFTFRINLKSTFNTKNLKDFKQRTEALFQRHQGMQMIFDVAYPKDTVRSHINCAKGFLAVEKDEEVKILFGKSEDERAISFDCSPVKLHEGDAIIYSDGYNLLRVVKQINRQTYIARVMYSGQIWTNKAFHFTPEILCGGVFTERTIESINLLDASLPISIALSFIESSQEIYEFKRLLRHPYPVIAKIETQTGLDSLPDILQQSKIAMLGRGDLLYHSSPTNYLLNQKMFADLCKSNETYSIVATDILDSMATRSFPNRSEITDLLFLMNIGCDAIILSNYLVSSPNFINCYTFIQHVSHQYNLETFGEVFE